MKIKNLRIRLIGIEKTLRWLAAELGYSPAYVYQVLDNDNQKEIKRIVEILEREEKNAEL